MVGFSSWIFIFNPKAKPFCMIYVVRETGRYIYRYTVHFALVKFRNAPYVESTQLGLLGLRLLG